MTNSEFIIRAQAVLEEAEKQGFKNTAEAMRQVISGFETSTKKSGFQGASRKE